MLLRKNNRFSVERYFRDHCVYHDGTLYRCKANISRPVFPQLYDYLRCYAEMGIDKKQLVPLFARFSVSAMLDNGRKTVMLDDLINANGHILPRELL